jgi:NAD-dependent SIR2 family protein deacetylase
MVTPDQAVGGCMAEAYCVKCKTKRQMQNEEKITMKNGRPATQGKCPECGTKLFKIGA